MKAAPAIEREFQGLAASICDRLARNLRVRRNLPGGGRVRIDRQLPFLCVYRSPVAAADAGTRDLVTTEASYLFASSAPEYHDGLVFLCREIKETLQEHFGTFLLIEIWSDPDAVPQWQSEPPSPGFLIVTPDADAIPSTIDALSNALRNVDVNGRAPLVKRRKASAVAPPGMKPLLDAEGRLVQIGLAIKPVFRDGASGTVYPIVLQRLRRQLASAIRQAVFAFTDTGLNADGHYEALGPTALTRASREADQLLCEVASSFDFLLQVTPINSALAWEKFRDGGYAEEPQFHYRPLTYHPNLLKRRLFEVPVERMEDATLSHLCWEKQDELDRQLTALRDLDTRNFLFSSLQLYGDAADWLVALAKELLRKLPPRQVNEPDEFADAAEVTRRVKAELAHYQRSMAEFEAATVVREDVAAGLMVAQDRLFVSESIRLRRDRIEPLLHHEVGTHLLTYFNGKRQPFGQLYVGLAGYEPLQEGLAILAEYLVGGLTAARLRTLAGRVIAVKCMTTGASFVEAFRHLHHDLRFGARSAFMTVLRVFRGGGLTKDAIYLRGFHELLEYLARGHDIEPLYVGKIGLHHVPFVREMRRRGVLKPPGALPRFWDDRKVRARVEACRRLSLLQLAEQAS